MKAVENKILKISDRVESPETNIGVVVVSEV